MNLVELIAKKRDGFELSAEHIQTLITSHSTGTLTDYQMTAFLMAVYFQGMSSRETVALTQAMLHSGRVIDLSHLPGSKVDKHSTGGVGDKVSLCLAPIVAACGVKVPMVSGRGLGHTGGTLDKLEAIPGFTVNLDIPTFENIVRDVGTCMIGQTQDIAPADKRIYALRDVTATVESIPLIVASILSKKLAEGIDGLVLDVKVGRGAFMKNLEQARRLAQALVSVGTAAGKKVTALLTNMDVPLGNTIGNAIETREAIDILHGKGPDDTRECTMALAEEMLLVGGACKTKPEARSRILQSITTGQAREVMKKMIAAQHGDPSVVDHPSRLMLAPHTVDIVAKQSGFIADMNPLELGLVAVSMGAGRTRADQAVDPSVGIELTTKPGSSIEKDQVVARLYVQPNTDTVEYVRRIEQAILISPTPPAAASLILERID